MIHVVNNVLYKFFELIHKKKNNGHKMHYFKKKKEDIGIKTCVVILIQKFHNGLINVFVALRPRTYRTHQVKYNYLIINYINATKYCTDMFRFVLLEST